MLLKDGQAVEVNGETFHVSQSMMRLSKKSKQVLTVGQKSSIALALTAAALALSKKARMVAAFSGISFASLFGLMYLKPVSQFVVSFFLPAVMKGMDKATRQVKEELLSRSIYGDVLDFGCGDGQYLNYIGKYKDRVTSVVSLEPNRFLHSKIQRRVAENGLEDKARLFGGFGEDLLEAHGPDQFDCIIVGNVLCEVPSQGPILRTLHSLLKPGGRLFFLEHVAAEQGTWLRRIQDAINPVWVHISDGCNCNRTTLEEIERLPWDVHAWELEMEMPLIKRLVTGLAVKRGTTESDSGGSSKL